MKILLIGLSVRALAESAVHSRYPIVALDAFGDRDLREFAEAYSLRKDFGVLYSAQALVDSSRKLDYDAVAYTSNLENFPEALERFDRAIRIIGNPPQIIRAVRNWADLFLRLESAGFAVPRTIFPDLPGGWDGGVRWLLKPRLSGGGHGISFFKGGHLASDSLMLQQYIEGTPCSASFVANGRDAVLLGITEQLVGMETLGVRGFRYCGNLLPLPETVDPWLGPLILKQARDIAGFLASSFGLVGVNGFDFIFDGRKLWLTEVNPRYSASMELMERAYGLPVFHLHCQAVIQGSLPEFDLESRLGDKMFLGKGILFCENDCVAPVTLDYPDCVLKDIPGAGERLQRGGPICTLLVQGNSRRDVSAGLVRAAAALREQIYG